MKIHLVLFHTKTAYGQEGFYDVSIERLVETFKKFGGDEVYVFNDGNINGTYKELQYLNDNKLEAFGHYAFKPLVILNVFEKLLPNLKYDKEYNIKNWKNLYDVYIENEFM
jgi:hypothetical protein